MGVDLEIQFEFDGDAVALNELAYDLSRRVNPSFFHKHPCLVTETEYASEWDDSEPSDEGVARVLTWARWWGPGYERGDWPEQRAVLSFLMAAQAAGKIGTIWCYPDYTDRADDVIWTVERMAESDTHFATGHWGYRWDAWGSTSPLSGEFSPEVPLDSYGKPMRRSGWGANYAKYYSPADGKAIEFRNGTRTVVEP